MSKLKSQNARICQHLRAGIDALNQFGSLRLAARIHDIREKGFNIESETVSENGKRFKRYWMPEGERT